MSPAVVLAIVVATQNVDDKATEAMRATAVEALGSEDAVVVRAVEVPSDSEALRVERLLHAKTAAQVVWLDAAHTRARLRVHAVESGRWLERTIAFSSVDTPNERGRALGFALTSMLPEETLAANPHRRPLPPAPSMTADGDYGTSVRAGGAFSLGLGGNATGLGGSVAGEFYVTPTWLVRLSFSARWGHLPRLAPYATDFAGYGGLGVAWWPMRHTPGRSLAVGFRVDALVLFHSVTGPSDTAMDARTTQNKVLPGVDALGEVAWNAWDSFEIVGSLGLESAIGPTGIELDAAQKDVIPIARVVAEVGIRYSF
jgi:hypothetical protein